MNTRIIRKIDKNRRLTIGVELIRICNLKVNSKVAICRVDDTKIMIRDLKNIKDCIIITTATIEGKGRIQIPKEIKENTCRFDVYAINGNLIIEEAH